MMLNSLVDWLLPQSESVGLKGLNYYHLMFYSDKMAHKQIFTIFGVIITLTFDPKRTKDTNLMKWFTKCRLHKDASTQ